MQAGDATNFRDGRLSECLEERHQNTLRSRVTAPSHLEPRKGLVLEFELGLQDWGRGGLCRCASLKLTIDVRREIRCVPVLHLGRAVMMVCSWFVGPAFELVRGRCGMMSVVFERSEFRVPSLFDF